MTVRPFEPKDMPAVVTFRNLSRAPHRHDSVAAWENREKMRTAEWTDLRLVVGDPAVAYLDIADLNTTPMRMKDVCEMDLYVAPSCRCLGIGSDLYERALAWARERGAKRLLTYLHEDTPDEPGIAFLQKRGFVEQERESNSYLDLTTFDPASFEPTVSRAQASGVRLCSFRELGDTDTNRRRLYDLFATLVYDIPRRDEQPFEVETYGDWVRISLDRPEWVPDLFWIAEASDGRLVGLTFVTPRAEGTAGGQDLTGVLPAYRGRGLATALKICAYQAAQTHGLTAVGTENHVDNAPMLAVNRKLGFIREPDTVLYNKVLPAAK